MENALPAQLLVVRVLMEVGKHILPDRNPLLIGKVLLKLLHGVDVPIPPPRTADQQISKVEQDEKEGDQRQAAPQPKTG